MRKLRFSSVDLYLDTSRFNSEERANSTHWIGDWVDPRANWTTYCFIKRNEGRKTKKSHTSRFLFSQLKTKSVVWPLHEVDIFKEDSVSLQKIAFYIQIMVECVCCRLSSEHEIFLWTHRLCRQISCVYINITITILDTIYRLFLF
jgi:hypothetical protein